MKYAITIFFGILWHILLIAWALTIVPWWIVLVWCVLYLFTMMGSVALGVVIDRRVNHEAVRDDLQRTSGPMILSEDDKVLHDLSSSPSP